MDLRNGKSINNFQGMFPVRPTSAPTTAIGATPTAPPSIRMQSLQRARRLLSDLATPSSDRQSPDVPARPSLRPATKIQWPTKLLLMMMFWGVFSSRGSVLGMVIQGSHPLTIPGSVHRLNYGQTIEAEIKY
uniref:Uncharacterized protein n=1 Tax=Magallana gigas TaxID=29159 RepID=A0A8W8IEP8_MAGGI